MYTKVKTTVYGITLKSWLSSIIGKIIETIIRTFRIIGFLVTCGFYEFPILVTSSRYISCHLIYRKIKSHKAKDWKLSPVVCRGKPPRILDPFFLYL